MSKTIQEIFNNHLNDFAIDIVRFTTGMFETDKRLDPIVMALTIKEGKLSIAVLAGLGQFFTNDHGKEVAARIIKEAAKEIKPVAIAFATEAWISEKSVEEIDKILDKDGSYKEGIVRPSEDPKRREVLMIHLEIGRAHV